MTNTETTDTAATVAANTAHVAAEKAPPKKAASQRKGAPKAKKTAKGAKGKVRGKARNKAVKEGAGLRIESKGAKIMALIARAKGATLAEIMKATEWQTQACAASSRPPARSTASK